MTASSVRRRERREKRERLHRRRETRRHGPTGWGAARTAPGTVVLIALLALLFAVGARLEERRRSREGARWAPCCGSATGFALAAGRGDRWVPIGR